MSIIKGKKEYKTILDFSKGKVSKNLVKQALRRAEIIEAVRSLNTVTFIENSIQVGMYCIVLRFPSYDAGFSRKRLRDYGKFSIDINEVGNRSSINLERDRRFKNQYWVSLNKERDLLMKTLTDIIVYCGRLNKMKMFL